MRRRAVLTPTVFWEESVSSFDVRTDHSRQRNIGVLRMDGWIRWGAAAIAIALPAYAYQYSTVGTAQQQGFPGAHFEEIQPQRVWKALATGPPVIFSSTTLSASISTLIIRSLSARMAVSAAWKS